MKKIFVIKLGGKFIEQKNSLYSLLQAICVLVNKGYGICVVHGGGKQADVMQKKLHIPIKKINGKRITDKKTLDITKMIYKGLLNTNLIAMCNAYSIPAVGISGVDCMLAMVTKRPVVSVINYSTGKKNTIDFGYVGDIQKINIEIVKYLQNGGYVPIIACLGTDNKGNIFNINADMLAVQVALELKAEKLIFVTDTQGVYKNKDKYISSLAIKDAKNMISKKEIHSGMIPKIESSESALYGGIKNIQILGGLTTSKNWLDAIHKQSSGTNIYKI